MTPLLRWSPGARGRGKGSHIYACPAWNPLDGPRQSGGRAHSPHGVKLSEVTPVRAPASPSLLSLWFPIYKISRSSEVTPEGSSRLYQSPCDPVTPSHHPARFHCSTCTGSISRALDLPSSSREQSGTLATPSNYPHSKTSRAKLACAAAPSTDNARHLNREFLLCQHFHCEPVQWPRRGGPTDPRPCQADTPPLQFLESASPGHPTLVPGIGSEPGESSHSFSYPSPHSLSVSCLLSGKAA